MDLLERLGALLLLGVIVGTPIGLGVFILMKWDRYRSGVFKSEMASPGVALADSNSSLAEHILKSQHESLQRDRERKISRRILKEVRQRVWHRDGAKCVECGSRYRLHFDHVIPVAKGGDNTMENIQVLCRACNLAKGAKI